MVHLTVGTGIAPLSVHAWLADYTAGGEFHPAGEDSPIIQLFQPWRSGQQPLHHLVGGLEIVRFLQDAARDIRVSGDVRLVIAESGGGKVLKPSYIDGKQTG